MHWNNYTVCSQIYAKYFTRTQGSLLSTGLHLVVQDDDQVCHLGTFDGDNLVSYVSLHNTGEYWQVHMQCTLLEYRGQGYVRKSIEIAIQKYGCVISDVGQTQEAQRTWSALIRRPNLFHYYWLNLGTKSQVKIRVENGQITPNPWDETDATVILACDRQFSESALQRMRARQEIDQARGRPDRWLGPGFTEFNP
jgi:hypothetical protein